MRIPKNSSLAAEISSLIFFSLAPKSRLSLPKIDLQASQWFLRILASRQPWRGQDGRCGECARNRHRNTRRSSVADGSRCASLRFCPPPCVKQSHSFCQTSTLWTRTHPRLHAFVFAPYFQPHSLCALCCHRRLGAARSWRGRMPLLPMAGRKSGVGDPMPLGTHFLPKVTPACAGSSGPMAISLLATLTLIPPQSGGGVLSHHFMSFALCAAPKYGICVACRCTEAPRWLIGGRRVGADFVSTVFPRRIWRAVWP